MTKRSIVVLIPALMFVVMMSRGFLGQSGVGAKTVWDGVYADSQATSGQAIFTETCAACHGENLAGGLGEGAPPLVGDKFMENWREDNLQSLFTKILMT